jgi:hypothetical protein
MNRLAIALGAALLAVAAVITLAWSGSSLDLPQAVSVAAVDRWYRTVEPARVVLAAAWAAGAVITVWLVVALVLQLLAAMAGLGALRGLADRISPRSMQRLGHALAGLSLTAGLAAAPSAGTPPPGGPGAPPTSEVVPLAVREPGTATMTRLPEAPEPAAPTTVEPTTTSRPRDVATTVAAPDVTVAEPGASPSTTLTTADPGGVAGPLDIEPDGASAAGHKGDGGGPLAERALPVAPVWRTPEPDRSDARGSRTETIVVEPGMSFWSIAEEVMAEGAPFGARELHQYWRALIAANEDRLVVRGNADLLLPGQQLVLPPR